MRPAVRDNTVNNLKRISKQLKNRIMATKSKFGKLNSKDIIKGLIVAVATALLTGALQLFQAGPVEWTFAFWQPTVYGGITAGIAYLLKNVLTNSEDNIGKGEPV
jgi:hypothetical protein